MAGTHAHAFLALPVLSLLVALTLGMANAYDWANPGPGPWRGQVVDLETRQPLEGVVVVAVWEKRHGSLAGLAGGGYFASEEVVTGPDGRFTIAPLQKKLLDPFAIVKGPEFYIFKGGYGKWKFPGQELWQKLDVDESEKRMHDTWRRFNAEGVEIELEKLPSKDAQLRFMAYMSTPSVDVPSGAIRRFREAIKSERARLGLQ